MKTNRLWCLITGVSSVLACATFLSTSPALALPEISLTPSSGAAGTEVTVSGTGFESFGGTEVRVFFGDDEITDSPILVSSNGTFMAKFTVPGHTSGTVYVTVSTAIGGKVGQSFTVQAPAVMLDVGTANVGEAVGLNGRGFYASGIVTIYYYRDTGRTNVAEANVDGRGNFATNFTVPESTTGSHRVRVEDEEGTSVQARLEVTPALSVKPVAGAVGDTCTVSGTGFVGEGRVIVYFDDSRVAQEATGQNGSFQATFNVPAVQSGNADIVAEDSAGHHARTFFGVAARINLIPASGFVGAQVQVNGVGFRPGVLVNLSYEGSPLATELADTYGSFSALINVPESSGGHHDVAATDGLNTADAIFTMETVAPPTPELLSPGDGERTESQPNFRWEEVRDDSSLTYSIQVATKKSFSRSSLVAEASGLIEPEYWVTEDDKLGPRTRETPYYWRVRAIDRAGNKGEWSLVGSFYVTAPFRLSTTATRVLIGVGIGGAAFLGFWFGRKHALKV